MNKGNRDKIITGILAVILIIIIHVIIHVLLKLFFDFDFLSVQSFMIAFAICIPIICIMFKGGKG